MRIEFTVVDDDGTTFEGEAELRATAAEDKRRRIPKPKPAQQASTVGAEVDFAKPLRPFIKTYGKDLSGPKKFTLVLSWLAKGDPGNQVPLGEVQKQWKKMAGKSLLGMKFNHFFPAAARNNDWVESKKQGVYNLRPDWRNALKGRG